MCSCIVARLIVEIVAVAQPRSPHLEDARTRQNCGGEAKQFERLVLELRGFGTT
jgi:hypothetical protein